MDDDVSARIDAFLRAGREQPAADLCRQVLQAEPSDPRANLVLGRLLAGSGQRLPAILLLEQGLASSPGDPRLLTARADLHLADGEPAEAEACARNALAVAGGDLGALGALGAAQAARHDLPGAAATFETMRQAPRGAAEGNFRLANLRLAAGDDVAARTCFAAAVSADSTYHARHRAAALVLRGEGRLHEAREMAVAGRRLGAQDPELEYLSAALEGRAPTTAPDDYVRAHFDAFAASFDATLVEDLGYQGPSILGELLVPLLEADGRGPRAVLDAGCGTGLCAAIVKPWASSLVGVDLSSEMIARAARLELYDELVVGGLVDVLGARHAAFDLIVAADVLLYFGDLDVVVAAARSALRPGGMIAFNTELTEADAPVFQSSARWAHPVGAVLGAAAAAGMSVAALEMRPIRHERGVPVNGTFVVLGD